MTVATFKPWASKVDEPPLPWPNDADYALTNARLPATLLDDPPADALDGGGLVLSNLVVRAGRLAAVGRELPADLPRLDLQGGQVWPACVELHTHLDKGHTVPRACNPSATLSGAVQATALDRTAHWSARDVERRFEFSLQCAYVHGTALMRTHIDSYGPQAAISWPIFRRLRESWSGRVDLQGVCLTSLDGYGGAEGAKLADLVTENGGMLGGVTRFADARHTLHADQLQDALERLLSLAAERQVDVDLHVDETPDLEPNTLKAVAQAVLRTGFKRQVTCGHCCSLALRSPSDMQETIALVRDAGICIVTLPLINMHLQSRVAGTTPRWRGVTALQELRAAGVTVALSSDNCRDPFYSFGDFDPVEVFRESVRICQLDGDPAAWLQGLTRWPAEVMHGAARGRFALGSPADLIAFRARSFSELLSRPQSDRWVLRGGRPLREALPDYRELDDLFAGA